MKPVDVDIDNVLDDIVRVLQQRDTGRSQTYSSEVRQIEDTTYLLPGAWQNIVDSLQALDMSLAPLEKAPPDERQSLPGRMAADVKRLAKRVIQKTVYWYVNPIVAQLHRMHASSDRAMHEIADQLKNVNDRLEMLERSNLGGRISSLEGERFDERIGRLERAWRERVTAEPPRAPIPASAGLEVAPMEEGFAPGRPRGVGKDRSVPADRLRPTRPFHFDYYWFESIHRGDRALIKRRQQPYLEAFIGCENVLDVGCGRGEFLELMNEKNIGGYGIDIELDAVQFCTDAGLRAVEAEAIEHLSGLTDEGLDGVFISQVAEHLTPSELIELVGLVYQKMKPMGSIVIETPNPQCLLIFASFFYADLSHVQPIHPETMRFLLLSAGFRDVEIKMTNPVPRKQRLSTIPVPGVEGDDEWVKELNSNMDKLNSVLFSYMDYTAIGRK